MQTSASPAARSECAHSERLVGERLAAVRGRIPPRALVVLGLAVARVAIRQEPERAVAPERRCAVVGRAERELARRHRRIGEVDPPEVVHELPAVGVEPRHRDRRPRPVGRDGERVGATQLQEPIDVERAHRFTSSGAAGP
jgi:hypothetical protein